MSAPGAALNVKFADCTSRGVELAINSTTNPVKVTSRIWTLFASITGAMRGTVRVDVLLGWPETFRVTTISPATVPVCTAGIEALDDPAAMVNAVVVGGEAGQVVAEKQTPGFVYGVGRFAAFSLKLRVMVPDTGAGATCADCTCPFVIVDPGCCVPLGSERETSGLIMRGNCLAAVCPLLSVTVTVRLLVPAVVGVPEMIPVLAVSVSPEGSVPELIPQVYGETPL